MPKFSVWIGVEPGSGGGIRYAGEVERAELYFGWPVRNLAFVCPICLLMWSHIIKDGSRDRPGTPYQIQSASCEDCEPTHWIVNSIPGSILDNSSFAIGPDLDLLEALPEPLLKREYNLHLAQYDRYLLNEPTIQPNEFGCYTYADLEAFDAAWCGRSVKPVERRECPG